MVRYNVSVIVPIYNVSNYLEQCLKSISNQTMDNIEVICIDDGSTDGSGIILDEYAVSRDNFVIIHKANAGYGAAVNDGIRIATGEYVGIVEPDDYVLPEMFRQLYCSAKENGCDIVKGDFYRFSGMKEKLEKKYVKTALEDSNYNRIIVPREEKACFRYVMNTWSGIYRKAFLIENNIFHNETPGASYQDNGFWFKGFCCAKSILFVPYANYMNRRDNPSSSVRNKEKVYCGNEEYRYLYDFLNCNKELKDIFLDVYMLKRYHTFNFTLGRIDDSFVYDYLLDISKEYSESLRKGELTREVFTSSEWNEIKHIIRDPEEYYYISLKQRIKFSLILAVKNNETELEGLLENIRSQAFENFEIICVDYGSTDNSKEILEEYALKDTRFVVLDEDIDSECQALKCGIDCSRGTYIYFLKVGYSYENRMLGDIFWLAESDKSDVIVIPSSIDKGIDSYHNSGLRIDQELINDKNSISASQCKKGIFNCFGFSIYNKAFRRSFLLNHEIDFLEQEIASEISFTFSALLNASSISVSHRTLMHQASLNGNIIVNPEVVCDSLCKDLCQLKSNLKMFGIWAMYSSIYSECAISTIILFLAWIDSADSKYIWNRIREKWLSLLEISVEDASTRPNTGNNAIPKLFDASCTFEEFTNSMNLTNCDNHYTDNNSEAEIDVANIISKESCEEYRNRINEIENSLSYKIGRAITFLPRKIRGW